ncbi:MAG: Rrf2 family transcriptional regulator [Bacillota bacterium]
MQLSTKARYAVRALVELAICYSQAPVKLKDIANKQNISLKYLEQVMFPLRVSGYVKTHKGSQGGYVLTKPPEQVSVLEIVECVEGSLSPVDCVDDPDICNRVDVCVVRDVWVDLKESISNNLGNITFADLVKRKKDIQKE